MKQAILKGDMIDDIVEALVRKGQVKVTRLGTLEVVKYPSRMGHDISLGKIRKFNAYKKVEFRATKSLKKKINK